MTAAQCLSAVAAYLDQAAAAEVASGAPGVSMEDRAAAVADAEWARLEACRAIEYYGQTRYRAGLAEGQRQAG